MITKSRWIVGPGCDERIPPNYSVPLLVALDYTYAGMGVTLISDFFIVVKGGTDTWKCLHNSLWGRGQTKLGRIRGF